MAFSLPWEAAAGLAAAGGSVGGALALTRSPRTRSVGAFVREGSMLLALYGLWRLAGRLSVTGTDGAMGRAEWIRRFEADVHLPSEAGLQHLVLGHSLLVQAANIYYAVVHFPATILFLAWLFLRHRDRYRPVRWVLVTTTLCCLLIQLMPVAPPRMMPGIVDTARLYGQSVYDSGFDADQLSAMPSVHVAWALLLGYFIWRIADSRWRVIGPVHAALTVAVVLVTGNHWWLDCIVAAVVLTFCGWSVTWVRNRRQRVRPAAVLATDGAGEQAAPAVTELVGDEPGVELGGGS